MHNHASAFLAPPPAAMSSYGSAAGGSSSSSSSSAEGGGGAPCLSPRAAALVHSLRSALQGAKSEAEARLLSAMFSNEYSSSSASERLARADRAGALALERARARSAAALMDDELSALSQGRPLM